MTEHDPGAVRPDGGLDVDVITEAMVKFRGVLRSDLMSAGKEQSIVWPRHELTYLLHDLGGLSVSAVARVMSRRDYSAVTRSLQRMRARIAEEPIYRESYEKMRAYVVAHAGLRVAKREQAAGGVARRVLIARSSAQPADVQSLAVTMLAVSSILESRELTDAEARLAARSVMMNSVVASDGRV